MKLVLIEWQDSRQPSPGWQWLDDFELGEVVMCQTVGWVVGRSKEALAVAQNIGDDGEQASGIIRIPRRCILKQTELKGAQS
jgi:hypothetical protein